MIIPSDDIREYIDLLDNTKIYDKNSVYLKNKAIIELEKFNDVKNAIELLEDSLKIKRNTTVVILLITYLVYSNNIQKAMQIKDQYKYILSREDLFNIEKDLYDKKKDYVEAYNTVQKLISIDSDLKYRYISTLSYYLLLQRKYSEAKELLKDYLEIKNYNKKLEAEIINYELASMKLNPSYNVNKSRLETIYSKTRNELTKAAICALEKKELDVLKHLNRQLEIEPIVAPDFQEFFISLESIIGKYEDLIMKKISAVGFGLLQDIIADLDQVDSIRCFFAALFLARDQKVDLEQAEDDIKIIIVKDELTN